VINCDRLVNLMLQTLMTEYREFAARIDELNEVGSVYDASLKGLEISTTPITRSTQPLHLLHSLLCNY